MTSFVRDSRFRNLSISVTKREHHYEALKISDHAIETNGLATNSHFVAYLDSQGGGAAVAVLPLSNVGKVHVPLSSSTHQQPVIRAHSQPVQDIKFNPFHENILSSCSMDGTIKIFYIPDDGLLENISSPLLSLSSSEGIPFREIIYHPYAQNIVVSRGTRNICLFDVASNQQVCSTDRSLFAGGDIQSICWSYHGDVMAVTGKNKKIKLLDLRQSSSSSNASVQVAETNGHQGMKGSRITWLGDSHSFISTGHNAMQEREMMLWDDRVLSKPVKRERLDMNMNLMMPLYDVDSNLLVLLGKGDSSLRVYECCSHSNSSTDNYSSSDLYLLSTVPLGEGMKGCCMAPKQICDVTACEVLKILCSTTGSSSSGHQQSIQPVSFKVPRKERLKFHDDLYPDSVWSAPAAATADEWLSGVNAACLRIPIIVPAGLTCNPSPPAAATTPTVAAVISPSPPSSSTLAKATPPIPPVAVAAPSQQEQSSSAAEVVTSSKSAIASTTTTVVPSASSDYIPPEQQPQQSLKANTAAGIITTAATVASPSSSSSSSSSSSTSSSSSSSSRKITNSLTTSTKALSLSPTATIEVATSTKKAEQVVRTATEPDDRDDNTISNTNDTNTTESSSSKQQSQQQSSTSTTIAYGSTIKFRHVYGVEAPRNKTYYNLRPNTLSDNALLACSDEYWAVPYQGAGGGPVYVSHMKQYGKVLPECAVINGHKSAVTDLAFSPFHTGLLATAGGDCVIKLWQLPTTQQSDQHFTAMPNIAETDAIVTIAKHTQSIRTLDFHPTVTGLLFTTSQDMTVKLFDVSAGGREITSISLNSGSSSSNSTFTDSISTSTAIPNNLSFKYDGSLCLVTCRDRIIRIIDPRTQSFVMSTVDPNSIANSSSSGNSYFGRNLRATWCSGYNSGTDGAILGVSSAIVSGSRMVHVYDPRKLCQQAVNIIPIDNGSGQLYPMYDEGSGLCFVAGKGDTIIRYYELNFLKGVDNNSSNSIKNNNNSNTAESSSSSSSSSSSPSLFTCDKANDFTSGHEPIAGICLAPKRMVDVRSVEICQLMKLTTDKVIPISFTLSRAENLKTYFQDDVYLPIRSKTSQANVNDWICSCNSNNNSSIKKNNITNNNSNNNMNNSNTSTPLSSILPTEFLQPVFETMKPTDMMNLSEKPVELPKRLKTVDFKAAMEQKAEEKRQKDGMIRKLSDLANQRAIYHPNPSGGSHGFKVDAKPIQDDDQDEIDWDNE